MHCHRGIPFVEYERTKGKSAAYLLV